jgi:hypothetical protein
MRRNLAISEGGEKWLNSYFFVLETLIQCACHFKTNSSLRTVSS